MQTDLKWPLQLLPATYKELPHLQKEGAHQEHLMPEYPALRSSFTENGHCALNLNKRKLPQDRNNHTKVTKLFVRQKYWEWTTTIQLNSLWVAAVYEQPPYLSDYSSGFFGVAVEWEDDTLPLAPRISGSVYISGFAENVSFVPSSALFPFNDSFAANPICELFKSMHIL